MVGILKEALVWNGTLYKGLSQPIYTRCWSRSRLAVPLSMIVDSTLISCLSWRALPPSSQVIRCRKFSRRVSHAMLLVSPNRFRLSVNQDSPSREGRALTFG
ncbi:unnamed protein product [Lathyrus sativus]|nr:unnamed protein product [Lathyrus sativus]